MQGDNTKDESNTNENTIINNEGKCNIKHTILRLVLPYFYMFDRPID
ncbi:MAG: hypothetical protein ACLU2J_00480 [Clostridia bacterium]